MEKITRKLMAILLVISIFFTSSYTNVFAYDVSARSLKDGSNGDVSSGEDTTAPSDQDTAPPTNEDTNLPEDGNSIPSTEPTTSVENTENSSEVNEDKETNKNQQDVTHILKNLSRKIFQNNKEVPKGGTLEFEKNVQVEYKFKVPLELDEPQDKVFAKGGDFVITEVPKGLRIISPGERDVEIILDGERIKVGTLYFQSGGKNAQDTLKIVFDENINADSHYELTDLQIVQKVSLQWDTNSQYQDPGKRVITIYEQEYVLETKERENKIQGKKTGEVDVQNKLINWKVEVSNKYVDDNSPASLNGYSFEDDLTSVGIYKDGSFKVNTEDNLQNAKAPEDGFTKEENKLKYTFKEEDGNRLFIYFQTEIPNNKFFQQNISIENIAKIKKENKPDVDIRGVANRKNLNWIKKQAVNKEDDVIEWTITVNEPAYNFGDKILQIEDKLPENLEFLSANLYEFNGDEKVDLGAINPNENIFSLQNVNKKMQIVIQTKAKKEGIGVETFKNKATLKFPNELNLPNMSTEATSSIGKNPIQKSAMGYNNKAREITWKVDFLELTKEYDDLLLADLIVYGNNKSINLDEATVSGEYGEILKSFKGKNIAYNQRYVENSLSTTSGLQLEVLPVTQNDVEVGQLLIIKNIDFNNKTPLQYKTIVTDPNIYSVNRTTAVNNTISLFDGNKNLFNSTATQNVASKVMNKDMISRNSSKALEKNPEDLRSVNSGNPGQNGVFDYIDKTATFRIHVNYNGTDLSELGEITIQDRMQNGWERKNIGDKPFLLYEGTGYNAQGFVRAEKYIPEEEYREFLTFSEDSRDINFKFKEIDKSYVIIVKIGLKDDKILNDFSKNINHSARNDGNFISPKIKGIQNDWEDFRYSSNILTKGKPVSKDGRLTWTVDYKPYDISRENIQLRDSLPYGIDIVRDKQGNIQYGNQGIVIKELILQNDGTYREGATLENPEKYIEYNFEERDLIFKFPDASKGYRLIYKTDITGDPGRIVNKVSLEALGIGTGNVGSEYQINDSDVTASARRGISLDVLTKDNNGRNVNGAEIALIVKENGNILRQAESKNGKLRIRSIPEGEYILKEVKTPSNYAPNTEEVNIKVKSNDKGGYNLLINDKVVESPKEEFIYYDKSSVGSLKVYNTVSSTNTDKIDTEKKFKFDFKLSNDNLYNYEIFNADETVAKVGTIKSGDKFELTHDQYIVVKDIPKGTTYEVIEEDYVQDYYQTIYTTENYGTIVEEQQSQVNVQNIYTLKGMVTVLKQVIGKDADLSKQFNFKLTLDNYKKDREYLYTIIRSDLSIERGQIESEQFEFKLANDDKFHLLTPINTKYTIEEDSSYLEEYRLETIGDTIGTIDKDNSNIEVTFINDKIQKGNLKISNVTTGYKSDKNKEFEIKVQLDTDKSFDYETNIEDNLSGKIKDGDKIILKHNQYINIKDIPENTKYKITTEDYTQDYYQTIYPKGNERTIEGNKDNLIEVQNIYTLKGMLVVKNKVAGENADLSRQFDFKLTLDNYNNKEKYLYTIIRSDLSVEKGQIEDKNFEFKLGNNDKFYVLLPLDCEYTIVQDSKYSNEYKLEVSGKTSDTITKDATHKQVLFVNNKIKKENNSQGSLGDGSSLNGSKPTLTIPTNNSSVLDFSTKTDEKGNKIEIVKYEDGNILEIVKDKEGNTLETKKIEKGIVTKTSIDKDGNIIEIVTDEKGNIIRSKKTENNITTETVVEENGTIVETVIDENGNIIRSKKTENNITTETIVEENGTIVETVTDENGNFIRSKKTEKDTITERIVDEQGNIVETIRDVKGYIIYSTKYDKNGNVIEKNGKVLSNNVKNGDDFNITLHIKFILLSVLSLMLLCFYKKRKCNIK